MLVGWERVYDTDALSRAREAVLIDEYDKPILNAEGRDKLQEDNRELLRDFYGVLKAMSDSLRFA